MPLPEILTIKGQVYQYLRKSILSGDIKPGQRINEVEIAKNLKISRSPVHSAIGELIGEGLLESVSNKSVQVRQLTEKQVLDVLEFRMMVEPYSIRKIVGRLDAKTCAALEEFKSKFMRFSCYESISDYIEVDERFHEFLVKAAGNEIIIESYRRYVTLINPFRIISLESKRRFDESVPEHIQIIDSMIAKNPETAIESCSTHLRLASDQIEKYFKRQS